jgi:hypothetical protein
MKFVALTVAVLLCASGASAQDSGRQKQIRPMHPYPRVNAPPQRRALEQQFRRRSEQVVRSRLNLNDGQVTRLRTVSADIDGKRNALVEQEHSVRSVLRSEMAKGSSASQDRVTQLMAQARDLQAKRFALQQDEQQQLSGFLTPVQVAQYVGLQAQIRQRMREMQRGQQPAGKGPQQP